MITKLILESDIKKYLKQLTTFKLNSHQEKFYKWQYEVHKEIKCQSYKVNEELVVIVNNFLKYEKLQKKQCYYNSYKLTAHNSDVKYIDGFSSIHGIPIEHAWNYYKGIYFDLTREIVLKDDVTKIDYVEILKLNQKEVFKFASKTGHSGSYISVYFIKNIK